MAKLCILEIKERQFLVGLLTVGLENGLIRGEEALRSALNLKDKIGAGLPTPGPDESVARVLKPAAAPPPNGGPK